MATSLFNTEVKVLTNASDIVDVFCDESVYEHISDDFAPDRNEYDPTEIMLFDGVYYIGGYCDGELASCVLFHPHNSVLYEIHVAVLPRWRGKVALELINKSFSWIFKNTDCVKVIANIPSTNAKAITLAKMVGMNVEGNNVDSYLKNGVLLDLIMFGIRKGELTCLQQ
ncbi:MAG TPA: N-acetyltransferase [Gammaproteobacteria bacterium]|nr:N-acetyltransferase [Gammaproteobacteria bacterium]